MSLTSTRVPSGAPASATDATVPPLTRISVPLCCPRARVLSVKCDTDAIDGSASPRNPMVAMAAGSSARLILLVACRSSERLVGEMNQPVAHVAKPERHFGADVDDVAADKAVERLTLAIHALHEREDIAPRVEHLRDEFGIGFFDQALLERVDPSRQFFKQ